MDFRLKMLTPLWTAGAVRGQMDRVRETGIIGSLRFWYEAALRAMDLHICDPTSDNNENRCRLEEGGSLCAACRLFGATGQSRRFRLRIDGGAELFYGNNVLLPSGRVHNRRTGGWYLQAQSRTGDLTIKIVPLARVDEINNLLLPLALIHRHASLGAKISNGYGVVEINNKDGKPITVGQALIDSLDGNARSVQPSGLPDLRDFFFAKLRFQEPASNLQWWQKIQCINQVKGNAASFLQNCKKRGLLPLSPAIRNWLRYIWFPSLFQSGKSPGRLEEGFLFGQTMANNNIASKINVSHAYRLDNGEWEFRIWGWIPHTLPQRLNLNRDSFIRDLKDLLSNSRTDWRPVFGTGSRITPTLSEWHSRESTDRDGAAYLKELLNINPKAGTP